MIILILIGIIPALIVSFIVIRGYVNRAVSLRIVNVQNQCEIIADTLVSEGYLADTNNPNVDSELALLSSVYSGRLIVVNNDLRVVKDTYDLDTGRISVSTEVIDCLLEGSTTSIYDSDNHFIEILQPIYDKDRQCIEGVLVAAISTNEILQTAKRMEWVGTAAILLVCLLVLFGGYFLSAVLVKPFHRVTKAIEDMTDGYAEDSISVPDYTETQQITDAFNTMLSRVKNVDNSRNSFVSNVSHELKTPMTSMKVLAESLVAQDNVPVEMYREFMEDIVQEIDRENRIITDLLDMVRMDRKAGQLDITKVDIGGLLEQIVHRLIPIADLKHVSLILEADAKTEAEVDELKISTALQNIIENAVKYNLEGGWVRIELKNDKKTFVVNISDCGIGIPEEQQEQIFERFYRGDVSHSREIEGTGLGLWISRQAVLLHRGNISIYSTPGEGTTFSVRIPLAFDGGKDKKVTENA
ncbi:MAG: HAMP domain-containing sensor histidine kinase [Lachnospiraceae bacterium]|nr:HAMP domain-containing sensor histidine kinase [Lachnospiraceae bacterium]